MILGRYLLYTSVHKCMRQIVSAKKIVTFVNTLNLAAYLPRPNSPVSSCMAVSTLNALWIPSIVFQMPGVYITPEHRSGPYI